MRGYFPSFLLISVLLISSLTYLTASSLADRTAKMLITTRDNSGRILQKFETIKAVPLSQSTNEEDEFVVRMDTKTTYQSIDGFGAALTYSSAYVIMNYLKEADREAFIKFFFNQKDNSSRRINYLRLSIGACDFSPYDYSYADKPGDMDLKSFSIDIEKKEVLPVLKMILKENPNIKILASPWSPPAWMKTSNSMKGGSLKPEYYGVYAKYFVKYIQAMKKEGVNIDAITVQNEPFVVQVTYPSSYMQAEDMRDFIKYHLGPQFRANNITTKIIVMDHNWDVPLYAQPILQDPETAQYVDGTAFHGYCCSVKDMDPIHQLYPDKNIYFTEISGGTWAPNLWENLKWYTENLVIGAMRRFSKNILFWNLALDEFGGPTNNGCLTCRGAVTVFRNGSIAQNAESFVFMHTSHFIDPGALRCQVNQFTNIGLRTVGFVNPDQSKVIVIMHDRDVIRKFTLIEGYTKYIITIRGQDIVSLKWP